MDDPKATLSDDEFHFSEAEEAQSNPFETEESGYSEKKGGKINRKNVLIAVGIIVVALSLYKLIGVFFGSGTSKKPTTVATMATSQPTVTTSEITAKKPIQIQSTPTISSELKSQLSDMQAHDDASKSQMEQMTSQLATLGSSLENLSNSVNEIQQQLQGLGSQLQAQQSAISALKVRAVKPKKYVPRKARVYVPRTKWFVQALIPGRAWLIQPNGKTITVSRGDSLKGYGRISTISVTKGIVKTSTGAILQFRDS